jgi:hypothetical protein
MAPHELLPASYLASCEKFFKELKDKHQASSNKRQASSFRIPKGSGNFKKK